MIRADSDLARKDMLLWSQPIITDLAQEAYAGLLGARHHSLRVLAAMHARWWRVILGDETEKVAATRVDLTNLARLCGLGREAVDTLDDAILNDLVDVVTSRFSRSPQNVRLYVGLLLRASASLVEQRLVTS